MCIRDRLAGSGGANSFVEGFRFFAESAGTDVGLFFAVAEKLHPFMADRAARVSFHHHVLAVAAFAIRADQHFALLAVDGKHHFSAFRAGCFTDVVV